MKRIILMAALAVATLSACKDGKDVEDSMEEMGNDIENTANEMGNEMEEEMNETTMAVNDQYNKQMNYSNDEVTKMTQDFESDVTMDDNNMVTIKNWDSYTTLRNDLKTLAGTTPVNMNKDSQSMMMTFKQLKATIPSYLRIDDVNDAIRDVEKEMAEYQKEMKGANATMDNNKENIEEIQEAYDDLEKEIRQAREKYVDNKADAMEEYMEELNDKDANQSLTERYLDASEEYREEMNDK